mmetsp:Transcript_18093/g.42625  ORF Transcript_18093/g.42625 Transcript_18093/m.42625 type:complete len:240 (+) Transcript_18093:264-983(+)
MDRCTSGTRSCSKCSKCSGTLAHTAPSPRRLSHPPTTLAQAPHRSPVLTLPPSPLVVSWSVERRRMRQFCSQANLLTRLSARTCSLPSRLSTAATSISITRPRSCACLSHFGWMSARPLEQRSPLTVLPKAAPMDQASLPSATAPLREMTPLARAPSPSVPSTLCDPVRTLLTSSPPAVTGTCRRRCWTRRGDRCSRTKPTTTGSRTTQRTWTTSRTLRSRRKTEQTCWAGSLPCAMRS